MSEVIDRIEALIDADFAVKDALAENGVAGVEKLIGELSHKAEILEGMAANVDAIEHGELTLSPDAADMLLDVAREHYSAQIRLNFARDLYEAARKAAASQAAPGTESDN